MTCFIYYYLFILFIINIYFWGIIHAVIIYHILFIIVVLILLHLSYCVNVCHVFVCICRDHNGNKYLHFFLSSLYLMYFVFISYVYLSNIFTFYIK